MKIIAAPIVFLSAFLTLIVVTSASAQQLIQNGGFETGNFSGWTLSGNTNYTTVVTNSPFARSGRYGMKLGPSGSHGFMSQTLHTASSQLYSISLWLYSGDGLTPNEFRVSWNGTTIFYQTNIGGIGWTNLQFAVRSEYFSTNSVLQFGFRDDPSYLGLDDISVQASVVYANTSAAYTFTTVAGYPGYGSADGVGSAAQFASPTGIAVDTNGTVFVVDSGNHTIRKITPVGAVTTIAGLAGVSGYADGMGRTARFNFTASVLVYPDPYVRAPVFTGIGVDSAGSVYVSDSGNFRIRKITPQGTNWTVSTIAGGSTGSLDGIGTNAQFYSPSGIAVGSSGNIYVGDHTTLRKITPVGTNWVVTTLATDADFFGFLPLPSGYGGIAVDGVENIYLAASYRWIEKVTPAGSLSILTNVPCFSVAVDNAGNIFAVQGDYHSHVSLGVSNTIQKVTAGGVVSTIAGSSGNRGYGNGTGTNALFYDPHGIAIDRSGRMYVTDTGNNLIRTISSAGAVGILAGSGSVSGGSTDGSGSIARFNEPTGLALDASGNLYVADSANHTIRTINSAGLVNTVAGMAGNSGSADGVGSNARFNKPQGLVVDTSGNVYVADAGNNSIRSITPAGVVNTIAGRIAGYLDGLGTNAQFSYPCGISLDAAGNLYVTDERNLAVRKISHNSGNWVVSTIIAPNGPGGVENPQNYLRFELITGESLGYFCGQFTGIALDGIGNLYLMITYPDSCGNTRTVYGSIVEVTPTMLLRNNAGPFGERPASNPPWFTFPNLSGVVVDSTGNSYLADSLGNTVLKITSTGATWVVSTIGGASGSLGSSDGAGSAALFNSPSGIAVDSSGNIYVADSGNNTIRKGVFTQYTATNPAPFIRPPMNGQLVVTLLPAEAKGRWRFPWELTWRDSGQAATNLVEGNYPIQFRSQPGWLAIPPTLTVAVTNNGITPATSQYYPTITTVDTNGIAGSLTVNIGPNPPSGAGWRFLGDNTPFLPSGYTTNLLPGIYLIEFAQVTSRSKPANQATQVYVGLPTILTANYLLAASPPPEASLPMEVPSTQVNNLSEHPFGFNGQLQSDVGYGSGVAVLGNVVLTVAHLVFNDQTLSYVGQAYWLFQQEKGLFEPKPLQARGWYVLSGYAAQRSNDLQIYNPNVSTPHSRNLDVAALYFLSPVAGGGYGGYLPSDAIPNPWLTSTSLKMLVGYPVDGSLFGDARIIPGKMYQTHPQPYALSLATESVANQQVYTASWFLSYPGNSGGPLYVQFNGYYYPAAVYLGILNTGVDYLAAVRAIDSNVVNLITLAATLGDAGTNNPGGGVITIIPAQGITANNPGYIQLQLGPPAAVRAGAAWRLQGDTPYSTAANYTRAIISTNEVRVEFQEVAGWNRPTNQTLVALPGQFVPYNALYTPTPPTNLVGPISRTNRIGETSSFSVTAAGAPPLSYQWQFNGVDIPQATNANLVLADLKSSQSGEYRVVVTTGYGGLATSIPATLVVAPMPPVLSIDRTSQNFILTLSGSEGAVYRLEQATTLNPSSWLLFTNVTLFSTSQKITNLLPTNAATWFFRASSPN